MNREIKFRFWDKQNQEMNFQSLHELTEDDVWFDGVTDCWAVLFDSHNEQERFICMQFTGLKDKNDKDIYEGDVVKYADDKPQIVEYRECCFCTYQKHNKHVLRLKIFKGINKYEVVGNIHEKPKLLES